MGRLIGERYEVELSRPLPGAGGGVSAFAAVDHRDARGGLMAVLLPNGQAPRTLAIAALAADPPPGVLAPLAYGSAADADGAEQCFVVCDAPPGPAVPLAGAGMAEARLLATVLLPAATALDGLRRRGVTHRAIRPDNLFQGRAAGTVTLGCAWAGPPGRLQPAAFEPPYVAMCHPSGRGEGTTADDVYALGVTLLALALGRVPMAGLNRDAVVLRKLEMGSFAALTGSERLPSVLLILLRGMLADEPEHRPSPESLTDIASTVARRVVTALVRRPLTAFEGFGTPVTGARSLAFSIARDPERGARLLRSGVIDRWLRRGLGDLALATAVDNVHRGKTGGPAADPACMDAMLANRAVAALDPLAPVCWRGVVLWPDGLGPMLTEAVSKGSEHRAPLEELIALEILPAWAASHPQRPCFADARHQARLAKAWLSTWGEGAWIDRVAYALTPGSRCRSDWLGGHCVTRVSELLTALDALGRHGPPDGRPLDRGVAPFVAAVADRGGETEVVTLLDGARGKLGTLAELRVFARLQAKHRPGPLPGLAAWLARDGGLSAAGWRSVTRRRTREQQLQGFVDAGHLAGMLDVVDCPVERSRDARDAKQAKVLVRQIDERMQELRGSLSSPGTESLLAGRELAAQLGVIAAGLAVLVQGAF